MVSFCNINLEYYCVLLTVDTSSLASYIHLLWLDSNLCFSDFSEINLCDEEKVNKQVDGINLPLIIYNNGLLSINR